MIRKKLNISLLLVLLTIFMCSAVEFVLLEVKYQIFAGGFLQYHQLTNIVDIVSFIIFFLGYNTILYFGSFLVWRTILRHFKIADSLVSFHFMMVAGIITAASLVIQFQLHKYFSDAMDLVLIKNIAGGDLNNAIKYVMDEFFLLLLGLILLVIIYITIYFFLRGALLRLDVVEEKTVKKTKVSDIGYGLLILPVIAASLLIVNQDDDLRYNLSKSNAFSIFVSGLDYLSDFDQDGYGSFSYPVDFDIFNSNNYPGALDIPGNGIDEDNLFGDFNRNTLIADIAIDNGISVNNNIKHVVIIMMESTRADIIGKRINGRLVVPNLTGLIAEGRSFEQAYSHTGYTSSSLASFFSGRIGNFDPTQSLFSILDARGFQLAVFSGQDESWGNLDKKLGTRKHSSYFYDAQTGAEYRVFPSRLPSSIKLSEETLWQQFKSYSGRTNWQQPQYVYFNMQAGHFPYYHPKMTKQFIDEGIPRSQINVENKEWLHKTYWNAINYADIYIGKIITELKSKEQWQNTLFIVTGDHGEELFDNNHLGHGFYMSEEQTRVPFLTNQRDFSVGEPFGHSDVKSHILDYMFNNQRSAREAINNNKFVFQFIGPLDNPSKISLRYGKLKQIILDLRNMQVMPLGKNLWLSFNKAMAQPEIRLDLKKLVLHWEGLRWQSHLESN